MGHAVTGHRPKVPALSESRGNGEPRHLPEVSPGERPGLRYQLALGPLSSWLFHGSFKVSKLPALWTQKDVGILGCGTWRAQD